jgi:hypothetical protein
MRHFRRPRLSLPHAVKSSPRALKVLKNGKSQPASVTICATLVVTELLNEFVQNWIRNTRSAFRCISALR